MERADAVDTLSPADTSSASRSQLRPTFEESSTVQAGNAPRLPSELTSNLSHNSPRERAIRIHIPNETFSSEAVTPPEHLPELQNQTNQDDMVADSDSFSSEQNQSSEEALGSDVNKADTGLVIEENASSDPNNCRCDMSILSRRDSVKLKAIIWDHMIFNCYEQSALALISERSFLQDLNDHYQERSRGIGKLPRIAHDPCESVNTSDIDTFYTENNFQLQTRKLIIEHVRVGHITDAISLANRVLSSLSPPRMIRDAQPELYIDLLCQEFVELIRAGKTFDAFWYMRHVLIPIDTNGAAAQMKVKKLIPLLAYENAENSPHTKLLDMDVRGSLADRLNSVLIAEQRGRSGVFANKSELEVFLMKVAFTVQKVTGQTLSLEALLERVQQS